MCQKSTHKPTSKATSYLFGFFGVAFLFMAVFLMISQHSTNQRLDQLYQSISSLEKLVETQENVLDLQKQQSALEQDSKELQNETQSWIDTSEQLRSQLNAMHMLFALEENFRNNDMFACELNIQVILDSDYDLVLHTMNHRYGARYDQLEAMITADWDANWKETTYQRYTILD